MLCDLHIYSIVLRQFQRPSYYLVPQTACVKEQFVPALDFKCCFEKCSLIIIGEQGPSQLVYLKLSDVT